MPLIKGLLRVRPAFGPPTEGGIVASFPANN